MFTERDIHEFSVDKLGHSELETINDLFYQYGLWGTHTSLKKELRVRHLQQRCHAEWQAILLEVFQAPQIQARFDEVLRTLNSSSGYYDIVVAVLALTVLNERVSLNALVDIFGHRVLDRAFQKDNRVAEFIDFRQGEVSHRSSVAARFVLTQVADPNLTVDVMSKMAQSLDKYLHANQLYNETLRSLTQFSQLEMVLPNRSVVQRRDAVFRFYERVKNLSYCRSNPQFWLQYAIAALVFEDFERAERYFQSAYALASRLGTYDTYKIDNHYARLLLEQACRCGSKEVGMRLFRRARKIIFEQIQKERMHYPYRVARQLGEFFDTFAGSLTQAQIEEIVNAAQFIARKIESLPPALQNQHFVRECLNIMNRIQQVAPKTQASGGN